MSRLGVADQQVGGAQLLTWRVTTAVRVFALALCVGAAISDRAVVESAPMLVVLACASALVSLLDWTTRTHTSTYWYVTAEAMAVTSLLTATQSTSHLGAYLAVPIVVAGVRHGPITTLNVTLLSALTAGAVLAVDPPPDTLERAGNAALWLMAGLGVGLLASWQSRSTRGLAARQAPYAAAHQLMLRLHQLAVSGSLGLDSTTVAAELDAELRRTTGAARVAILVVDPDGVLRPLLPVEDVERLMAETALPDAERTPGAAVVPLRGAHQVLGYAVLVGVPRWTPELDEAANLLADDFAVRLDTAVLFDDVRFLSAAEERNRIAREMHDGVAQEIVALGYVVDEIESVSGEPEVQRLATELREEVSRVVGEIRHSIFDLRHPVGGEDFTAALTDYVQGITRDSDLRVHLVLDTQGPDLTAYTQGELMRIAQEAVGNVRRHARATNLWVTLVDDGGRLRLEVADDGVGAATPRERHWGLQGMRERAAAIGADITIEPRPGGGTVVRLLTAPSVPTRGRAHHGHQSAAH